MAPRTPTVRFHARPVVIVLAVFGGLFTTSLAAALSNVLGGASAAWIVGCLVTCFWLRIVSCHIGVGSRVVVIANALHTYRIPLNRITAITYEFRPTLGYVLSIARDDGRSFAQLFRRARNPMAPFSLVFAGVMLVNVTVNIEALHRTGVGAVAISSLAIGALVLSVFAIVQLGASGRATALKAFNGSDTDWASFGHFMGPFDAEALLGAAFLAPSPANGAHAPCVLVVDGNGIRLCGSAEALGITLPYRELASVEIVPNSSPTRPRYLRGPRSDDHCYLRTRDGRYGLFAGSTTGLSDHLRSVGATVLNAGGRGMPRWHGDGLPDGPPAGASHTIQRPLPWLSSHRPDDLLFTSPSAEWPSPGFTIVAVPGLDTSPCTATMAPGGNSLNGAEPDTSCTTAKG